MPDSTKMKADMARQAVAIVGRGLVWPAPKGEDCRDGEAFWRLCAAGKSAVASAGAQHWPLGPRERLLAGDRAGEEHCAHDRWCGISDWSRVRDEIAAEIQEPTFFQRADRPAQMTLAAARQAVAGCKGWHTIDPARRKVILGHIALPTQAQQERVRAWLDQKADLRGEAFLALQRSAGLLSEPAALVAAYLKCRGGAQVLDAACASSLFALWEGVCEIVQGRADAVVVGGVSAADALYTQMGFSQLGALSASGRCRPFDYRGDGLIVGEGAGAFILRRLEDARKDGDEILAVVRGGGLSNDRDGGLLRPSQEGQLRAMRDAYRKAQLDPGSIDYMECHATGTKTGDRCEMGTLAALLQEKQEKKGPLPYLGATKANVGHWLTGAGAASLYKVISALQHETIVPVAGFYRWSAEIDRGWRKQVRVPRKVMPWPARDGVRRAAISGFGFGGSNAHILLERAEDPEEINLGPSRVFLPGALPREAHPVARLSGVSAAPKARAPLSVETETASDIPDKKHPLADASQLSPLHRVRLPLAKLGVSPRELHKSTAQQNMSLAAAIWLWRGWIKEQAPSDAAILAARCGVIVAIDTDFRACQFALRWQAILAGVDEPSSGSALKLPWDMPLDPEATLGHLGGIVASRIARAIGCGGPSYVVSAHRDPFAVARERAEQALIRGDLDTAIVVGVSCIDDEISAAFGAKRGDQNEGAIALLLRAEPRGDAAESDASKDVDREYKEAPGKGDGADFERLQDLPDRALDSAERSLSALMADPAITVFDQDSEETCFEVQTSFRWRPPCPSPVTPTPKERGALENPESEEETSAEAAPAQLSFFAPQVPATEAREASDETSGETSEKTLEGALAGGERPAGKPAEDPGRSVEGGESQSRGQRSLELGPSWDPALGSSDDLDLNALSPARASSTIADETLTPHAKGVTGGDAERLESWRDGVSIAYPADVRERESVVEPCGDGLEEGLKWSNLQQQSQAAFYALHRGIEDSIGQLSQWQARLREQAGGPGPSYAPYSDANAGRPSFAPKSTPQRPEPTAIAATNPPWLDREGCLTFARGKIADVLGPDFAPVDEFPTRVRLPDEPLMLVDRIVSIDAQPKSLGGGKIVTEHDVHAQRWYLDQGRIPVSVAVESGQADLFLASYLGIDFETRGEATYRLLDAVVTFHDQLPEVGETVRYDIEILEFFRQGQSWFFRFHFNASVAGQPLMSMREGCAGFFSPSQLEEGQGVVRSPLQSGRPGSGEVELCFAADLCPKSELSRAELDALIRGDLQRALGPAFGALSLQRPNTIPGGMLDLVHRVGSIQAKGGRWQRGRIFAEADIAPDDWFLTCHFVDDRVMPGTLMYECCLHSLRILLLAQGWVGEQGEVLWQPVLGVQSRLKCRGQVLESTQKVGYEVEIRQVTLDPYPQVIADATMYADGKPIVDISDMSLGLVGSSAQGLRVQWEQMRAGLQAEALANAAQSSEGGPGPQGANVAAVGEIEFLPALYDRRKILAYAAGKPSEAFGPQYAVFDHARKLARLPRPPFMLIDRIVAVEGPAFVCKAGASCRSQLRVDPQAWYFAANQQKEIPYSILLEIALQPCGWLAAYVGSALLSEQDLCFRNLGGEATLDPDGAALDSETSLRLDFRKPDLLTVDVKLISVSSSAGMILQSFDFCVRSEGQARTVYRGHTQFGFFSAKALQNQVGLSNVSPYLPPASELEPEMKLAQGRPAVPMAMPQDAPFPGEQMRMVDEVLAWLPQGGSRGLGWIRGRSGVDAKRWFFEAHFYQDPVWPGSLGIEAFLQLLKVMAKERWPEIQEFRTLSPSREHRWTYRGQILPSAQEVIVETEILEWDDQRRRVCASGWLWVDGRLIYRMEDFCIDGLTSL